MKRKDKTKRQLIEELEKMQQRIAELEIAAAESTGAEQATMAIENSWSFTETRRQLEEQRILRKAGSVISSSLDLEDVLSRLAEQLGWAVDATSAYICSYEPKAKTAKVLAEYYGPDACPEERVSDLGVTYYLSRDFPGTTDFLEAGQPQIVHLDDPDLPEPERAHMQQFGAQTTLNIPLHIGGQLTAYAELWESRGQREFTSEEIALCQGIAQQAAIAIENARLYQQAQEEIRERQQAERALRDSESRFRRVISSISDHIYMTEVFEERDKINRYLSPNVEELTSYPLEKFTADWNFWPSTVIHPDDRGMAAAQAAQLVKGQDSEVEYRLIRADGEIIWVRDSARVETEDRARIIYGVVSDITQRKRGEEALRKAHDELEKRVEERTAELAQANTILKEEIKERERTEIALAEERNLLRTLIDNLPDHIYVKDRKGHFLLANSAQAHFLGVAAPSDLVGKTIYEFYPDELADQYQADDQRIIKTGQPLINHVEPDLNKQTGDRVWTSTTKVPLRDSNGKAVGLVGISRDVTRLQEVNRLKTEFVSTAAHELRTPLTSILGFSEILLTRDLDLIRQQRYLRMIYEQSAHLAEIIDELLKISRLEAGRGLELKLELINMFKLIREVMMPFAETATAHLIKTEGLLELPPVTGDPFRLAQVARNVLSNAIKYSPQGGKITVRGRVVTGFAEISVEDEGIGMTPEQQMHLFEPFYRADTSDTSTSGTGLGLAISKLIIEQHGGKIWLESVLGVGTTAYFTLPLGEDQDGGSSR